MKCKEIIYLLISLSLFIAGILGYVNFKGYLQIVSVIVLILYIFCYAHNTIFCKITGELVISAMISGLLTSITMIAGLYSRFPLFQKAFVPIVLFVVVLIMAWLLLTKYKIFEDKNTDLIALSISYLFLLSSPWLVKLMKHPKLLALVAGFLVFIFHTFVKEWLPAIKQSFDVENGKSVASYKLSKVSKNYLKMIDFFNANVAVAYTLTSMMSFKHRHIWILNFNNDLFMVMLICAFEIAIELCLYSLLKHYFKHHLTLLDKLVVKK